MSDSGAADSVKSFESDGLTGRLAIAVFSLNRVLTATVVLFLIGFSLINYQQDMNLLTKSFGYCALVVTLLLPHQVVVAARSKEPRFGLTKDRVWCSFAPLPLNLPKVIAATDVRMVKVHPLAKTVVLLDGPRSGLAIPWRWVRLDDGRELSAVEGGAEIAALLGVPAYRIQGWIRKSDVEIYPRFPT